MEGKVCLMLVDGELDGKSAVVYCGKPAAGECNDYPYCSEHLPAYGIPYEAAPEPAPAESAPAETTIVEGSDQPPTTTEG